LITVLYSTDGFILLKDSFIIIIIIIIIITDFELFMLPGLVMGILIHSRLNYTDSSSGG